MTRSSFSDNPLLRVSRPVSACSRCRAAKVKCDGKLPACTACEKAGKENECSAANDQFARGKERSYVAALELRIEKLERRLAYARSRKASVAQHESDIPSTDSPDRKDSLAVIRAAIHRKAERKRETSDVNSLMSDFGFLSINATTRDFEPSVSNMTFARLVLAASFQERLPDIHSWNMPSKQEALGLVQYYMNTIYSIYPAFPDTAIYPQLDLIYAQDRSVKDSDYWLAFMVLAISSISQSRSNKDQHCMNGLYFVSRALRYADRALMPGYITQIQSLILLTQYSMLDPVHFDSWQLMGFTCRAIVDLGFHQDPPPEQISDKNQLDLRRKIFYVAYSLDRSISMVQMRAFSFTDAATNVAWPRPQSFSRRASISGQMLSNSEPAFLLFQLRRAQSHWYQILFQSDTTPLPDCDSFMWRMCQDMREWGDSLSTSLPVTIRERFDLELRYSYVYLLGPSSSTRAPHMSNYRRLLIFEHAIAYIDRMFELCHTRQAAIFYTYHDALRVFFMADQLNKVLTEAEDLILAGVTVPPPPTVPGQPLPPPLPPRPSGPATDNLERSLNGLEKANQTLANFGERWPDSAVLQRMFEGSSSNLMNRLRIRRQLKQRASPPQTHSSSPPMAREMRWVDVDVEAMMKGNIGGSRVKYEQ